MKMSRWWKNMTLSERAERFRDRGILGTCKSRRPASPCSICQIRIDFGEKYYYLTTGHTIRNGHIECVKDCSATYSRVKQAKSRIKRKAPPVQVSYMVEPLPEIKVNSIVIEIDPDLEEIYRKYEGNGVKLVVKQGKVTGISLSKGIDFQTVGEPINDSVREPNWKTPDPPYVDQRFIKPLSKKKGFMTRVIEAVVGAGR